MTRPEAVPEGETQAEKGQTAYSALFAHPATIPAHLPLETQILRAVSSETSRVSRFLMPSLVRTYVLFQVPVGIQTQARIEDPGVGRVVARCVCTVTFCSDIRRLCGFQIIYYVYLETVFCIFKSI